MNKLRKRIWAFYKKSVFNRLHMNICELSIICFLLYVVINIIFWWANSSLIMQILKKLVQIFCAITGINGFLQVYKHKIYRDLIFFDVAYFVTCIINPNLFGNLKVFIHFLILQGVCFYFGYRGKQESLIRIMKWISCFSTIVAILNNLFIVFPIGLPGYNIGYMFGRNYGFFAGSSSMLGALHAITCVWLFYLFYRNQNNMRKKVVPYFALIVNYIALIANGARGNYLLAVIGIAAVLSMYLLDHFHFRAIIKCLLRFCVSAFLLGVVMLGSGKMLPHVYTYFGHLFEDQIQLMSEKIDIVLYTLHPTQPYFVINGGIDQILCDHYTAYFVNAEIVSGNGEHADNFTDKEKNTGDMITDEEIFQNAALSKTDVMDTSSMQIRIAMWKEALMVWQQAPVLGVGRVNAGIYAEKMGAKWMSSSNESSHNSWLNILLWSGMLGVCVFGKFMLDVLKYFKQNLQQKCFAFSIILGFALYMILYPGFIYTSEILPLIFWICLGVVSRQEHEELWGIQKA